MDTSASAQVSKAPTEADKERYRREGRCYECGKQGHVVRACPTRPPRNPSQTQARSTTVVVNEPSSSKAPAYEKIGKAMLAVSDDEKQTFLDYMSNKGEELNFGNA